MLLLGVLQISNVTMLRYDQVVAVDGSRDGCLWQASGDELQQRHSSSRIVTCCPVWVQLEERLERLYILRFGLAEMAVEDLLR